MQKKISFKNSKGQRLVGVLHLPPGRGLRPAVIVQHGFKSSHRHHLIQAIAKKLEKKGFVVLRFALSGHRPSGGSYEDVLVSQFIKDVKSAIKFLLKQPRVNRHRLGLVGHSLGAFTALICANKLSRYIRSVVSIASSYDIDAIIKSYQRDQKINEIGSDYWVISGFKVTNKHYLDRLYLRKKYLISDIHCPVLVIHGSQDRRVNVKDAKMIYGLLNEPKSLRVIKRADHNFYSPSHLNQAVKATTDWFKKYLAQKESKTISAFILFGDRILLLKRSLRVGAYQSRWSGVGGYFEEGGTALKTAQKEIFEELGISPSKLENYIIGKSFKFSDKKIQKTWHIHPILFKLKKKPKIRLNWEHLSCRWLKPSRALKLRVIPHLRKDFKILKLIK